MTPPYMEALAAFEFENLSMDMAPYHASRQLEFVSYTSWYFNAGAFSISRTVERIRMVMSQARARGFAGVRICGNPSWLTIDRKWNTFLTYEHAITEPSRVSRCSLSALIRFARNAIAPSVS